MAPRPLPPPPLPITARLVAALLLLAFAQPLVVVTWLRLLTLVGEPFLDASSASSDGGLLRVVVAGVVVGPVLEELVFRGGVTRLLLRYAEERVAVIGSAVIFAAAHFSLQQAGHAFAIGLLLGLVYARTRALWPCMLTHMAVNGLPILCLAAAGVAEPSVAAALAQAERPAWLLARVVALGVGGLVLRRQLADAPALPTLTGPARTAAD